MSHLDYRHLNSLMGTPEPGISFGLVFRVPASGLTGTYDGGYLRTKSAPASAPAITDEYIIQSGTNVFTASRDTYVYVTQGGVLTFLAVANGAAKPTQATIGTDSLWVAKVVTDASNITSVDDLRANKGTVGMLKFLGPFEMSFVTAEQGASVNVPFDCDGRVVALYGVVSAALGATDNGTVTPAIGKNDVFTNITGGVVTHVASAAVGVRNNAIVTGANTFTRGQYLRLTSAKTTTNGRSHVMVLVEERI